MSNQQIIGWGYEGKSVDDLIEAANRFDAHMIVDIRMNAISRKKGFSKSRLRECLESAGLQYVHLRSLGNPKDNRAAFANPGTRDAQDAHSRFMTEILDAPEGQLAIHSLADFASGGNVIVLCYESDHSQCHRSIVIKEASKLLENRL